MPGRANFAFSLDLGVDNKIIAERKIPENLEVFTELKRVEVLNKTGEIVFADFEVRLW